MGYSTFTLQWVERKQVNKLNQHSTENYKKTAELVKHMTSKHEVMGLNEGSIFS